MLEYHGMTEWESITCQNPEPHEHRTMEIEVDLSERHGYLNFAPIPERLWVPPFKMEVWDWEAAAPASQPVEGEWCPMRCAISQTIAEHGIWEPPETLALLNVFEACRLDDGPWTFLDIGAQLGWFSMLAQHFGLYPWCIEADPEVAEILKRNLYRDDRPDVKHPDSAIVEDYRIDSETRPIDSVMRTVVKIDIEGAEMDAIRVLRPSFESGAIRAALIETTPRFGVNVEQMALMMMVYGFNAYLLPHILDEEYQEFDNLHDLERVTSPAEIAERAEAGNQINVLYLQPGIPLDAV